MYRLRTAFLWVSIAIISAPVAHAEWVGQYWPLWVGNSWTYQNVDVPGDTYTETVFEYVVHDGHPAVKLGDPHDYRIIGNTGRIITVYGECEDGVFQDYPQHVVVGEVHDGSVFEICMSTPCDSNLVRDWDAIDVAWRSNFRLNPAWDDLLWVISYERDQPQNIQNLAAASNLPPGLRPPSGAVTSLEWYQRGLGIVAISDVEAATGHLTNFYQLAAVHVGVDDSPSLRAVATLAPNVPNPFNPRTTIPFDLQDAEPVTLGIYDLAGRRVRALITAAPAVAGHHAVDWDGQDDGGRAQPTGTYICRLQAGGEVHARPLTLIR